METPLPDGFSRSLQLRHMRCLVAIAQERHLARAAERLAVSQPAVSRILAELEALAGARLVERSDSGRRGIRGLTPAGEGLLPHALRMLEAVQQAAVTLQPQTRHAPERLRVGALPSAAQSLLPEALARLRTQSPALRIEVRVAANDVLLDDLRAGTLDLVVGRMSDPRLMDGLSFELLRIEPMLLLVRAGHPLLRRRPGLHQLLALPWVVYPEGTVPRHHIESLLDARGVALPPGLTETLDIAVARGLVLRSDALWATPAGAVHEDLAAGRLKALTVETAGTEEPVGLLRRRDVVLPAVGETLAALLRSGAAPARRARKASARG